MIDPKIAERPGVSQPFVLYDGAVRGRLIRLNDVANTILGRHAYPDSISCMLAESMAAAVALADTIKFDGSFTLQMQGDGPVHTVVTDVTSEHALRGCVKFDDEEASISNLSSDPSFHHLIGQGHLAFTVDQGPDTDRYQGIIELVGNSIGECIQQYFRQSEQLETAIKIVADQSSSGSSSGMWQASAIMVQRMPHAGGNKSQDTDEDAWRSAVILLSSVKKEELLDNSLIEKELLHRLFGSIGGQLLESQEITVGCRCTRERSAKILASFPMDEVRSMAVDGKVSMKCEFCEIDFEFTEEDLKRLELQS